MHSIAPSLQSDDLGVVQETVQDSPGHRGISQHLEVWRGEPWGPEDNAPHQGDTAKTIVAEKTAPIVASEFQALPSLRFESQPLSPWVRVGAAALLEHQ